MHIQQSGMENASRHRQELEHFGEFTVVQRLGTGSMSTVDRALKRGDAGFVREVALKRLRPHRAQHVYLERRFFEEADLAARLSHGNIAQVHEFGSLGGVYYLSMEFVDGLDLATCLRDMRRDQRRMWPVVVLSLLYELLDGLAYAHEQHGNRAAIIHRDLCPGNIMLTRYGSVKIVDFGTAVSGTFTPLRSFEGKLSYAAPEAVKNTNPDARSDLYSCGVIAYELLTGLRPQMTGGKPPSSLAPCPPELDGWVMRALQPLRDLRYRSARHMLEAMLALCQKLSLYPDQKSVETWFANRR